MMMNTTATRQLISKLRAIDAAEQYLISRTHREIRDRQSAGRSYAASSSVVLASSVACILAAVALLHMWPLLAVGSSI